MQISTFFPDISDAETLENSSQQRECGPMPNVMAGRRAKYRWRPLFNAAKFG